ncbi:uncharacterized protein UTRI_04006 [Ustilago trichophora]|uniref:CBM1 domain-containing protein n=1 Tax=Ustilago trichophora TaxID=86804 RepID=A0A5C3E9T7_9BASI|nr:uncharacterized protein UTRI_04006 [Ustilago trichophora]
MRTVVRTIFLAALLASVGVAFALDMKCQSQSNCGLYQKCCSKGWYSDCYDELCPGGYTELP